MRKRARQTGRILCFLVENLKTIPSLSVKSLHRGVHIIHLPAYFFLLSKCRLDKLRLELHKFQGYLDEAEGRVSTHTLSAAGNRASSTTGINGSNNGGLSLKKLLGSKGPSSILPQHGGSDDSLSRSASDSSVSNPTAKPSLPSTPQPTHGYCKMLPAYSVVSHANVQPIRSSHSPESGVGSHASHTSLPDSEVERLYANAEAEIEAEADEDDTLNGSEVYENELLPVLGTCRALYTFEGQFFPIVLLLVIWWHTAYRKSTSTCMKENEYMFKRAVFVSIINYFSVCNSCPLFYL